MLMSEFYKKARKDGELEPPAVEFVAANDVINKRAAAEDKALMEVEIESSVARFRPRSRSLSPKNTPSGSATAIGASEKNARSGDLVTTLPQPTSVMTPVVTEGVLPLRELVDLDALPEVATTRPKKQVGVKATVEPNKKQRCPNEKGTEKNKEPVTEICYSPSEIDPRCLVDGYNPIVPPVLPGFHLTNCESFSAMRKVAGNLEVPDPKDNTTANMDVHLAELVQMESLIEQLNDRKQRVNATVFIRMYGSAVERPVDVESLKQEKNCLEDDYHSLQEKYDKLKDDASVKSDLAEMLSNQVKEHTAEIGK